MKAIWITFAAIALVATAVVWMFAAGWSGGRILFPLPDLDLLQTGQWFGWSIALLVFYGPLAFAIYAVTKAIRETDGAGMSAFHPLRTRAIVTIRDAHPDGSTGDSSPTPKDEERRNGSAA